MNIKLKIKKGDPVVVTSGRDKGKTGTVTKANPKEGTLIVAGVNIVKRHTKPSAMNAGGVIAKEAPIHISNVAYADPKTGKATKIGYKILEDGKKVRVAKKSGEIIN